VGRSADEPPSVPIAGINGPKPGLVVVQVKQEEKQFNTFLGLILVRLSEPERRT
jgi:hypothetical protein